MTNDAIETENNIEAAVIETLTGEYMTRILMSYYNDPDTDFPDAGEFPRFDLGRPDSRAPVTRTAALLLGLCLAAGASAFVAATGGGVGWTVAVFGVLAAEFALGVVAGR